MCATVCPCNRPAISGSILRLSEPALPVIKSHRDPCFTGRLSREERKQSKLTYAIEKQLRVYSALKFAVSAFTGIAVGLSLHALTVDLAGPFGLMAFCLNFIPNVGYATSSNIVDSQKH